MNGNNSNTPTLAAQFAVKYSKGVVNAAIWTVRIVRWSATAIMVAAMVSNYHHQVVYLDKHVDWLTAHIAPISLDLLTVICARILASIVMQAVSKTAAIRSIWFPIIASAALSFAAPGDLISKIVFAGMVGLIPIAEYVSSHAKVNFRAVEAEEISSVIPDSTAPVVDPEQKAKWAERGRKAADARKANAAAAAQLEAERVAALEAAASRPRISEEAIKARVAKAAATRAANKEAAALAAMTPAQRRKALAAKAEA